MIEIYIENTENEQIDGLIIFKLVHLQIFKLLKIKPYLAK
jgi:hypothetical protein